jgi:hypothetical protein
MPSFRTSSCPAKTQATNGVPVVREALGPLIGDILHPSHFFVGPGKDLTEEYRPAEEIPWEIFKGRLLDRTQTTQRRSFESWNVHWVDAEGRSTEPIVAILFDAESGRLHITRAIYCYAWEGYDAGGNVFLSRETRKWVRELVGTVALDRFRTLEDLRDELICQTFHAVAGASRLPLTSVESPLPAFSLGQLAYVYQASAPAAAREGGPMRSPAELVERGLHEDLGWLETTKLLETVLRAVSPEELPGAVVHFQERWSQLGRTRPQLAALLRNLFNAVALSPHAEAFISNALRFARLVLESEPDAENSYLDFLSYLLRNLARHLTAYDLVTFHHRGANYPDAILLDEALKGYLALADQYPEAFLPKGADTDRLGRRKRLRRRALRQGYLLRRFYEGLPVPDAPTSPGENARILPPPHQRVPEEQIFQPHKRTKRLFAGDPLEARLSTNVRRLLRQSWEDLQQAEELRELGTAIFLDRPLGVFKAPGEPDRTVLLSYEAFSRSIAERRLRYLAYDLGWLTEPATWEALLATVRNLQVPGISLPQDRRPPRPGVVALEDANQVADDFVFLRTTRQTAADFLALFDWTALAARCSLDYLTSGQRVLIVRAADQNEAPGSLVVYDAEGRKRLLLQVNPQQGYVTRGGVEVPAAGLSAACGLAVATRFRND